MKMKLHILFDKCPKNETVIRLYS